MIDAAVSIRLLYVDSFTDVVVPPISGLERRENLDVTVAETAADGLELADDGSDCIVAATELSDGSGFDFCETVRERVDAPVVMTGPEPAAEFADRSLAAGAVDYVPRSLLDESPELFASRLRRIVAEDPGPSRGSLLDVLPVPAFVADQRVHYANEAAGSVLANGDRIVDRPMDELFEDGPSPSGAERPDAGRRVSLIGTDETFVLRSAQLPESGSTLYVLLDEAGTTVDDELVRKASMLDSILENIPLAVYFKGEDGRHLAVSDFLPRMNPHEKIINPEGKVHHTTDDVIGKTDFDLYPSELATQTRADETEIMESEDPVINKTERTYTPDNELMRLSTSKAPWYGPDGDVVGVVGITANVSDEKRFQDTVEYQQNVLGSIQEVVDDSITETIEEIDQIVHEATADDRFGRELVTSVDEIQDHVSVVDVLLRKGRQRFDARLIDLEQIAQESWAATATETATMDVTYNGIIRADPDKVGRLFDEVFENAVVHGGPDVHVSVEQFEGGFFVADDGPGVDPGDRERVSDYGYSTDDDAIGSGLTIVDTIARSMDWELSILESTMGGFRLEVKGVEFE